MADSDNEKIHCPIGKWYFKRMTLLGLLLLGFGCWFLYDGFIGYPKGAFKAVAYEAFAAGGKEVSWEEYSGGKGPHFAEAGLEGEQLAIAKAAHEAGGQKATWDDFARKKKLDLAEPAAGSENRDLFEAFQAGGADGDWKTFATSKNLPEDPSNMEARDEKVDAVYNAFEGGGKQREWGPYAAGNDLPSKEPHFHGKSDVLEQYVIGGLCALAGLVAFVLMVLNKSRAVSADEEAYYPKPSVKVPFADVFKIDTRKWRRKGLAYAYYKTGRGDEKKAVLDDLKFVGSQGILDRMLGAFEGELIEEVIEEDDEVSEESAEENGGSEEEKVESKEE